MLIAERERRLLEYLKAQDYAALSDLSQALGVSEATVRRDLIRLERDGKVKRVHGGAKLAKASLEDSMQEKIHIRTKEKRRMARLVKELVGAGDCVFLDAGSSTGALIPELGKISGVQVVTNGYSHIPELMAQGIPTYLISGRVKAKTSAIVGARAVLALRDYCFDMAFLGANSIDEKGYYTPDAEEAIVKGAVQRHSKKVYILADSSKWKKKKGILFATREEAEWISERGKE